MGFLGGNNSGPGMPENLLPEGSRTVPKRGIGNVIGDFFSAEQQAARRPLSHGIGQVGDALSAIAQISRGETPTMLHQKLYEHNTERMRQEASRNAFADVFAKAAPDLQNLAGLDPKMAIEFLQATKPKASETPEFIRTLSALGVDVNTPEGRSIAQRAYDARFNRPDYIGNDEQGYSLSPAYKPIFQPQPAPQGQPTNDWLSQFTPEELQVMEREAKRRSGAIPQVSSAEAYNQLPPGTQYYDPDGNLRIKGGQ